MHKRGDVYEEDGVKWYVTNVIRMNGKESYGRVRVGSIAHDILSKGDSGVREEGERNEPTPEKISNPQYGISNSGDLV